MVWCSLAVKTTLHSEIILEKVIFRENKIQFCRILQERLTQKWLGGDFMQERVVEETTSQDKETNKKNPTKTKQTQAALHYSTLLCKICVVQAPAEVAACS